MERKRTGFSLIELLIVMAIILILSVIGLGGFIFSLKKSHDAARKSDLATIAKGLEAFANDFTAYPDDDGDGKIKACGSDVTVTSCNWGDAMKISIGGKEQTYMVKIPKDPASNQFYYYKKIDDGFELYAGLENSSDPNYSVVTDKFCGGGNVNCSYTLTQSGVK